MARHGQIHRYGGYEPRTCWDVIDNEDYKLRVNKTWVPAGECWHIKFTSASIYEHSFEIFLTKDELARLKDIL